MGEGNKCPLCFKEMEILFADGKDFFVASGNSQNFSINFCPDCGVGFSYPILSDDELNKFYPEDFEAYVPKKNLKAKLQTLKYKSDLQLIIKRLGSKNTPTLFEIGAGRGEFLDAARKFGFSVTGLEPGQAGIEFARTHYNIEITPGHSAEYSFDKKYDVVALRHTLEHLNDFECLLKKIYNNGLNESGLLIIKIPRADSWEAKFFGKYWHGYDLPRHRVHFTKQGIEKLLTKIGYTDITIKNEYLPYDALRSIKYIRRQEKNAVYSMLKKILTNFPDLSKTGRMIVYARK